jgi:hypothetical protein
VISDYSLVYAIAGPLIGGVTGWVAAFLQYRGQKLTGSRDNLLRLVNELQEQNFTSTQRLDAMGARIVAVRDILLQLVEITTGIEDPVAKAALMRAIREGLKSV